MNCTATLPTETNNIFETLQNGAHDTYNKVFGSPNKVFGSPEGTEYFNFSLSLSEKAISAAKSAHKIASHIFKNSTNPDLHKSLDVADTTINVISLSATSLLFTPWTCHNAYKRIFKFQKAVETKDKEDIIDHSFGILNDVKSLADKAKVIGSCVASLGWVADQSHWIAPLNHITTVLSVVAWFKTAIDAFQSNRALNAFEQVIEDTDNGAQFESIREYVKQNESDAKIPLATARLTDKGASKHFKKDLKSINECLQKIDERAKATNDPVDNRTEAVDLMRWRITRTHRSNCASVVLATAGIALTVMGMMSVTPIVIIGFSATLIIAGTTKIAMDYYNKKHFNNKLEELAGIAASDKINPSQISSISSDDLNSNMPKNSIVFEQNDGDSNKAIPNIDVLDANDKN
jgi:hypothetical protein